jgi:hypothetical protein
MRFFAFDVARTARHYPLVDRVQIRACATPSSASSPASTAIIAMHGSDVEGHPIRPRRVLESSKITTAPLA